MTFLKVSCSNFDLRRGQRDKWRQISFMGIQHLPFASAELMFEEPSRRPDSDCQEGRGMLELHPRISSGSSSGSKSRRSPLHHQTSSAAEGRSLYREAARRCSRTDNRAAKRKADMNSREI